MHEEKRPTCVTVIGWVWIVIGALLCVGAVWMLVLGFVFNYISGAPADSPDNAQVVLSRFAVWLVAASAQGAVGILAIVSGVQFLKLRPRARAILEALSWVFVVLVLAVAALLVGVAVKEALQGTGHPGLSIVFGVGTILTLVIYGVPLGIMLKCLRGQTVRGAMLPASRAPGRR